MATFWLIQRGRFRKEGTGLIGREGIINLDYMGSSEFEWGAIPKAYRRIMNDFSNYDIFHTDIYTPEKEELLLFCNKDKAEETMLAMRKYVEHPYHLKEFSELDKITTAKKDDDSWRGRRSNFWWCIDYNLIGDWMSFLQPQLLLFMGAIKEDYENWWMAKEPEQREKEYQKSLVR